MACKTYNAEIDGHAIYILQWPATKAMVMQAKLLSALGSNSLPFIYGEWRFGDLTRLISSTADPEEFVRLIKEFVQVARMDGQEITSATFDFTYSGDLMLAYKIFAFSCEAQFKDFFTQGLEMQEARERQDKASQPKAQ